MFPEDGQTRKHCFLAMFPKGEQTAKCCFCNKSFTWEFLFLETPSSLEAKFSPATSVGTFEQML
jgi:hypothetical protein